jgi:hypothetical protein
MIEQTTRTHHFVDGRPQRNLEPKTRTLLKKLQTCRYIETPTYGWEEPAVSYI